MDWNQARSGTANQRPRHPLAGTLTILGLAAFFLGLAAVFSWAAPYQVLTLTRHGDRTIRAQTSQRLLLLIPIREQVLEGVTELTTEDFTPQPEVRRENGRRVEVRGEKQSFLILKSATDSLKLPVSPVDRDSAAQQVREFLSGNELGLSLRLVANWKFGVLLPILISLPGGLLLLAALWSVVRWLLGGRAGEDG